METIKVLCVASMLLLLVVSSTFVSCDDPQQEQDDPQQQQQHRGISNGDPQQEQQELSGILRILKRSRRSFGLRSQCTKESKKFCKLFTVRGVTKSYCIVRMVPVCTALD